MKNSANHIWDFHASCYRTGLYLHHKKNKQTKKMDQQSSTMHIPNYIVIAIKLDASSVSLWFTAPVNQSSTLVKQGVASGAHTGACPAPPQSLTEENEPPSIHTHSRLWRVSWTFSIATTQLHNQPPCSPLFDSLPTSLPLVMPLGGKLLYSPAFFL